MKKKALITGITGQDGPYLAKLLLEKDYKVYGLLPRRSKQDFYNLDFLNIKDDIEYCVGDITDYNCMLKVISKVKPDEIYNLAAQSFVGNSWDLSSVTTEVNAMGPLNILNAIRVVNQKIKFYQASTSELYGNSSEKVQNETTRFQPSSPYAIAKLHAYWTTVNFRNSYNMFCCNGILFNHESPIRGIEFVTRKISDGVAQIFHGKKKISLGNLDAKRDWGFAGDYVDAMWMMLQQKKGNDYVIATGKQYTIKNLLDVAFECIGINDWKKYVTIDSRLKRPSELHSLCGNSQKAYKDFGWKSKTSFQELIKMMVDADLERNKQNLIQKKLDVSKNVKVSTFKYLKRTA